MTQSVALEFVALQTAVAGRYSLERELGRGGMGVVFLARDVALDRLVAIKLLPRELAAQPAYRERFLREARTAAKLSQPNIVPIFAVEEQGDLVFFVMAYVEGTTLGERLRERGPLTPHEAARLLQETAWALGYAHARGVVHRDVKPDNIMLEAGSGRAVVMDFGIAGAASRAAGGEVLGTAQYISPEQASAEPVDGRSDLYSLGVVAFLALTGKLPFEARDTHGLLAMHIARPAPTVLSVSPGLPRKLAQAVDRCLAKKPADRFPDGEALAEAITTSVERPRDLPAPVRAWLVKGEELRGFYLLYSATVLAPAGFLAARSLVYWLMRHTVYRGMEFPLATLLFFAAAGTLPFVIHASYRLFHTRRLMEAGYGLEDMRLALKTHAERRHEELVFERDREPSFVSKAIRGISWGAFATFLGTTGMIFFFPDYRDLIPTWLFAGSMLVATVGSVLSHIYPGIRLPSRDESADRRTRIWHGWFGQLTAKLAGWKLRKRTVPAELTYRPTEMAISLAADALYESLPKLLRKELKDLPAVVVSLQNDAALMRKTVDEMNSALASLGDTDDAARSSALAGAPPRADLAASRTALREEVTRKRDEAAQRLADAVASLETVRLSLLKLKAGTGTVGEITTDLAAARALTEAISFVVHGNAEVERLLAPTRTPSGPLVPRSV